MELWGVLYFDLCDTDAVLYQMSYQAIWELVILWVRNIFFSPFQDSPSQPCRSIPSSPTRKKPLAPRVVDDDQYLALIITEQEVSMDLGRGRKFRSTWLG